jgi:hypothetical protein
MNEQKNTQEPNSEAEKELPQETPKSDPKSHDWFPNLARRITTEMSSYSQKIITQFEPELRKSKRFEQE